MTPDRWLALIGILCSGGLSWLISRHFYLRADKRRTPTFVLRPQRKVLVESGLVSYSPDISVLFSGKEVGEYGITEAQIYFWNSGTLAVLRDDILEPFTVRLPGKVLCYSILKASRDLAGLQVSVPDATDEKQVLLQFNVLEPGDGATIQIIYDGPPDAKIEFGGACVGSAKPTVLPPDGVYFTPPSKRLLEMSAFLLIFPGAAALAGVFLGLGWVVKRLFGEHVATIAFVVVFSAFAMLGVGAALWEQYKKIRAPYMPPDIRL